VHPSHRDIENVNHFHRRYHDGYSRYDAN